MAEQRKRSWLVAAVALGQFCCLLLMVTGVTSHVLAKKNVSLPTTQSAMNYALLAAVFGAAELWKGQGSAQHPLWKYALLAFFDVEANFLVVMAYRYTSITSVSLSSVFSVPTVMLLSYWVLGSRYRPLHIGGAASAVVGLVYLVMTDRARSGDTASGSNPLLGDLLVVAGASMYAGTNVVQEHLLGSAPLAEVMCRLGLMGTLLSVVQAVLVEGSGILQADWLDPTVAAATAGYVIALFAYYNVEPFILRLGGAATLNLSLLAANFWDAGARIAFLGGFSPSSARDFAIALLLVALGMVAYSFAGAVTEDDSGICCSWKAKGVLSGQRRRQLLQQDTPGAEVDPACPLLHDRDTEQGGADQHSEG